MIKSSIKIAVTSLLLMSVTSAGTDFGTVNGEVISEDEISQTLGQQGIEFATLNKEMQKRVLDMVVDRKLLSQHAAKNKIEESKDFKEKLELIKKELVLNLWMEREAKRIESSISDADIKADYEKNKDMYKIPAQLKARHILVKTEDDAKKIIKSLEAAKDTKAEFIKLAKEKSTGPSGKNGGDLGWFALDRMVPEFSLAADKLKNGEYTKEPVKTQFGYHIIYLEDRKPEGIKTLDEVKEQIKAKINREKFNTFMDETVQKLKKDAKINLKTF
jgi:parvulin-like peptidyl-prolyl isomerase